MEEFNSIQKGKVVQFLCRFYFFWLLKEGDLTFSQHMNWVPHGHCSGLFTKFLHLHFTEHFQLNFDLPILEMGKQNLRRANLPS